MIMDDPTVTMSTTNSIHVKIKYLNNQKSTSPSPSPDKKIKLQKSQLLRKGGFRYKGLAN
jgi:hypothetical protein